MASGCGWTGDASSIAGRRTSPRSTRVPVTGGKRRFKVEYYENGWIRRTPIRDTEALNELAESRDLIALATLTFLEIVLGVDNIIFISILSGKLPPAQQPRARRIGLLLAMVTRILLLFSLAWIIRLTAPLLHRAWPGASRAAI